MTLNSTVTVYPLLEASPQQLVGQPVCWHAECGHVWDAGGLPASHLPAGKEMPALTSTTKERYSSTAFRSSCSPSKMHPVGKRLLARWYGMLGLSRHSPPSWYRDRIREELRERRIATTPCQRLSETSDVFFSISRARFDGFPVRRLPSITGPCHLLIYAYMFAKYTSRWSFYRMAARICRASQYDLMREVVNPTKDHNLEEVASRHRMDRAQFKRVGRRLRRVWPLFP